MPGPFPHLPLPAGRSTAKPWRKGLTEPPREPRGGGSEAMPERRMRRVLRLAGWNALLLMAALALVVLAGEAWLRSTLPFRWGHWPTAFVPGVGVMLPPDTEVRWTNQLDFWTVSRTNRLGFLDREPPSPQRAAESCHIAVIGDSFVEARQVPIPEKLHVRLEERAARELPHLDVTTSAFGFSHTGQIGQLAFYDGYARPLRPKLVVLVFVPNDYIDNFPLWTSLRTGLDPDHLPHVSAARAEDGGFRLRPPDPEYERFRLPPSGPPSTAQWRTPGKRALDASWFLSWLRTKHTLLFPGPDVDARVQRIGRAEMLARRPAHARLLDGWRPVSRGSLEMRPANEAVPSFFALFQEGNGSPFFKEALAFTAFGLDRFKERAERDGPALVILATHRMRRFGGGAFARMSEMAAERGIPVIDQGAYIHRQGAELRDAGWAHNDHWSPTGHRWAAEALLEYLERNQDVCERPASGRRASSDGRG